jgi:glycosyltransferase involved in cell wall biosynthesis
MRGEELRWVSRADAVVTVNDALADRLARRYGVHGIVAVHNCPSRWWPMDGEPDHLRAAARVDATTPIVLYHGGLMPHRGLEQIVRAMDRPQLAGVHAAFLGYGSARRDLERWIAASPAASRLHVIDAVDPEVLPAWIRFADVGVMPIQPSTINHVLSTPNKLFECLAVGVPVVASDFAGMRRIVLDDPDGPLGAVCDPADPDSIASAIDGILALPPAARADLHERALRAAHERWNWETESDKLVGLYQRLTDASPRDPASAGG